MEPVRAALTYITHLLRANDIPFQVVGGLAARAYGASRPIAEIDLYVPGDQLERISALASECVVRAPSHHRDSHWDMAFMALDYGGQRIELGAAEGRYYDHAAGCWRSAAVDFGRSELRELFGVVFPTMPLVQLMEYKRQLGREVDLQDVQELEHAANT